MLVISQKKGEKLHIGRDITISILDAKSGKVRLGIEAPSAFQVVRETINQNSGRTNSLSAASAATAATAAHADQAAPADHTAGTAPTVPVGQTDLAAQDGQAAATEVAAPAPLRRLSRRRTIELETASNVDSDLSERDQKTKKKK